MIKIVVNGEGRETRSEATLGELVVQLDLAHKRLAVEVNEVVVPKKEHDNTILTAGDRIEIVSFVGGG